MIFSLRIPLGCWIKELLVEITATIIIAEMILPVVETLNGLSLAQLPGLVQFGAAGCHRGKCVFMCL